jgi:hypothetical protein
VALFGDSLNEALKMAAARLVVELTIGEEDTTKLMAIARSRTETASRIERSRMLLAYQDDPSFFAVGQTVRRCVERAVAFGPLAALDDRKGATITPEAKTWLASWLASLACRNAKDLGYPHELWTTRLLARHAREHGPAAGHHCLSNLAQGAVCKTFGGQAIKPHKVRCYLQRRDPEFEVISGSLPSKNSTIASWPPSTTSTNTQSSTPDPTKSMRPPDMSRIHETLH